MTILMWILGSIGAVMFVFAAIAFLRAKDLYVMLQIACVTNFYILPMILLAVELDKFSLVSFVKVLVIIMLNIVMTILVAHMIAKRAIEAKVMPDADFKKRIL